MTPVAHHLGLQLGLLLAVGAYLLSFFHRVAPAAISGDLQSAFAIGGPQLGNLAATYFYVYTLMELSSGVLSDTLRPRRLLFWGGLVAGIGSLLFGLAPTFTLACLGRTLIGLGVSVTFIAMLKLIAVGYDERRFATMTGLCILVGNLGSIVAGDAKEGNAAVTQEPIIFMKAGSSVIGPGETILLPQGLGRMDHEVELAVVIGRRATGVKKKDAMKYVAGFTIINDVTARELQTKDLEKKHPWYRSKSFDTFTPMGPWIVTPDELGTPIHVGLECRVNGKSRQKSNTRSMVFDIPTQIEFITQHITFEPGDVLSTGTPHGIGPIEDGDEVICRIEKIGELKNPVKNK